jgi:CspA family cold shock protein
MGQNKKQNESEGSFEMQLTGKVKWFNPTKGFGFILGADGTDYFAHHSEIMQEGFRLLEPGDAVQFEPIQKEKGMAAKNIHILN